MSSLLWARSATLHLQLCLNYTAIIDSTAGFVAASANPIQFEDKIRENHRQDPKFSFLNSADPYHAYYRHRIERVRNGEVSVNEKEPQAAGTSKSPVPADTTDAIPKEPPPLHFVLNVPHKNALDLYVFPGLYCTCLAMTQKIDTVTFSNLLLSLLLAVARPSFDRYQRGKGVTTNSTSCDQITLYSLTSITWSNNTLKFSTHLPSN